jgi:hypothetical protein
MRFARPLSVLAGLALLSACADLVAPPASLRAVDVTGAIQGGEPTGDSRYANVGGLLVDFAPRGLTGDDLVCTGSLIAPDVFLTAAHCVVGWPQGIQFHVSFASDLYDRRAKFIAATGWVRDPRYGHDQANLHDLALVFLPSGSTRGITPVKLPTLGALDALAAKGELSKTMFVNVGYGVSANRTGVPQFGYDGLRSMSLSEFMGLQPTWLGLLMNASATGEGGDCYGDSGGPKFIDGDDTVIYATVTTGDMNCRATTWDWRLDTREAREFLGQYVKLP